MQKYFSLLRVNFEQPNQSYAPHGIIRIKLMEIFKINFLKDVILMFHKVNFFL